MGNPSEGKKVHNSYPLFGEIHCQEEEKKEKKSMREEDYRQSVYNVCSHFCLHLSSLKTVEPS